MLEGALRPSARFWLARRREASSASSAVPALLCDSGPAVTGRDDGLSPPAMLRTEDVPTAELSDGTTSVLSGSSFPPRASRTPPEPSSPPQRDARPIDPSPVRVPSLSLLTEALNQFWRGCSWPEPAGPVTTGAASNLLAQQGAKTRPGRPSGLALGLQPAGPSRA